MKKNWNVFGCNSHTNGISNFKEKKNWSKITFTESVKFRIFHETKCQHITKLVRIFDIWLLTATQTICYICMFVNWLISLLPTNEYYALTTLWKRLNSDAKWNRQYDFPSKQYGITNSIGMVSHEHKGIWIIVCVKCVRVCDIKLKGSKLKQHDIPFTNLY